MASGTNTAVRSGIHSRIKSIVGEFPAFSGNSEVGDPEINDGITQAVRTFSKQVPRIVVEDEVGDGGKYYPISNLAQWEDDFARIVSIDWDAGSRITSDEQSQFLSEDDGDWGYYRDASIRYFFFPDRTPSSSVTFRVTYSTVHTLDATESTIPLQYEEAIIYASISELCAMLACHAEKALDSPAGAEFVTMRTKSAGFKSVGDLFWNKYMREMGGSGVPAASKMREYDQRFLVGDSYLFHSGRQR